jgi:hypothetical protein
MYKILLNWLNRNEIQEWWSKIKDLRNLHFKYDRTDTKRQKSLTLVNLFNENHVNRCQRMWTTYPHTKWDKQSNTIGKCVARNFNFVNSKVSTSNLKISIFMWNINIWSTRQKLQLIDYFDTADFYTADLGEAAYTLNWGNFSSCFLYLRVQFSTQRKDLVRTWSVADWAFE